MNITLLQSAAILATGLYVLSAVLFFLLHLVQSEYTITSHAVSDYAIGATAKLFQLYVWSGTVGALVLTVLFYFSKQPAFSAFTIICMIVMIISRVGVSLFKTDLEGAPRTREGILHYVFAILAFAAAYTVLANATSAFLANDPSWIAPTMNVLQYLAMLALAGVVITMFKPLRRYFAVIERVFLLSTLLWFLLASFLLARG